MDPPDSRSLLTSETHAKHRCRSRTIAAVLSLTPVVIIGALFRQSDVAIQGNGAVEMVDESAQSFFKAMPKVELHTHLDGAVQPSTLCALALANNASKLLNTSYLGDSPPYGCRLGVTSRTAPVHSVELSGKSCSVSLIPYVTSEHTKDLTTFLEPFICISHFLLLPGGIELMGRTFVPQQVADNVMYTEVQIAPQLLLKSCNPFVDCLAESPAMISEVKEVVKRTIDGVASAAVKGTTVKLLLDCFRTFKVVLCEQLFKVAIEMKHSTDSSESPTGERYVYSDYIVGVNLAGDELTFPNVANPGGGESYEALFARMNGSLNTAGLGIAPHSGEPVFPRAAEDCVTATDFMGATRIGHGYHCTEQHWADMAKRNLHVEACPASSMATGAVGSWAKHPIRTMKALGLSMSLNTDDRAVIGTTMTDQYELARTRLDFSLMDLVKVAVDGIQSSFADQDLKHEVCGRIRSWWVDNVRTTASKWLAAKATTQAEIDILVSYLGSLDC